ncbi:MAG: hypothetical protein AB7S70_02165 [Hyphomicrobium sp.]|uniref:hypothetical protein n=1 Tax=Hyphomicrobium sp. TaxID=82 RepID=UPI003D150819
MLDTLPTDNITLRCEALFDRVAATPIGENAHALRVGLAECDAMERVIASPSAVYRLRDVRHWLRLAYGHTLHGYPPDELRRNLLKALAGFGAAARAVDSPVR